MAEAAGGAAPDRPTPGSVVLVTGAASGIGAAVMALLRAQGAAVVAVDRARPTAAFDDFIETDLADPASIDAALARAPARLDGLCNAAGVPITVGPELLAKVNYLGLRRLAEGLLPRLGPGGSVVNIGSTGGWNFRQRLDKHLELAAIADFDAGLAWLRAEGRLDGQAYGYLKEALIVWTMRQAQALRPAGVRINCVSPGPIDTPLADQVRQARGDESWNATLDKAGGLGGPDQVAPLVGFLFSPASAWISGANLAVDNGLSALYALTGAGGNVS